MFSQIRPLGVESLESRHLCAGDVQLHVSQGNVTLTGDEAANVFTVTQIGPNRYLARGAAGTTINHQASLQFSFSNNATINLAGGADRMTIGSSTANTRFHNNLTINAGSGADVLNLFRVLGVSGSTVMGTAQEDEVDTVNVRRSKFTGDVSLATGGGGDHFLVDRTQTTGNLRINTGAGNDSGRINSFTAGNVFLLCGSGNDYAYASGNNKLTGNLTADGGAGKDTGDHAAGTTFEVDLTKNFDVRNFEIDGLL